MAQQHVVIRCDDGAEAAVFTRTEWAVGEPSYELSFEDAYCCPEIVGIRGRFKRAWKAFVAKPINYTGIYVGEDAGRMKQFLQECLSLITTGDNEEASSD